MIAPADGDGCGGVGGGVGVINPRGGPNMIYTVKVVKKQKLVSPH